MVHPTGTCGVADDFTNAVIDEEEKSTVWYAIFPQKFAL